MNIQASNGVMNLGHQMDNLATVITFPIGDVVADQGAGGSWSVRIQRNGDVAAYPTSNFSVSNNNLNLILTSSDLANVGEGQIQLKYAVGSKVLMSRVYRFYSHYSLDASATVPEPWISWVDEVEADADRAEEAVAHYPYVDTTTKHWMQWDVEDEQFVDTGIDAEGQDGEDGEDGVSPVATVSKVGKVATITITDATGTTTAQVSDGNDGEAGPAGADGFSPSASVSKSGKVATITITDKDGTTTATVEDGDEQDLSAYRTSAAQDVIDATLQPKTDILLSSLDEQGRVVQSILAVDTEVGTKADASTTYTKTEVDTALGNKADTSALTAETTARTNADATLTANLAEQTRINTKQQRAIENLTKKSLTELKVTYPDTTYLKDEIPSSVMPNAGIEKCVGKTVVWNQLINKNNYPATVTTNGITFTNNGDGTITANGTATGGTAEFRVGDTRQSTLSFIVGHKYFLNGCPAGGSVDTYKFVDIWSGGLIDFGSGSIHQETSSSSIRVLAINIIEGTTVSNLVFKPSLIDLTMLYGSGNEPSSVSTFLSDYPILNGYAPYDSGTLKSSTLTGAWAEGVNLWDEEWELGGIANESGNEISSTTSIRNKGYIPINPSTAYYYRKGTTAGGFYLYEYDSEYRYIGFTDGDGLSGVLNTSANSHYLRFKFQSGYGVTYNHDVQICLNSATEKTTYHPYKRETLSFPSTIELKGAGNVGDEYVPESGVVTRKIKSVDLGTLDWSVNDGHVFHAELLDCKTQVSNVVSNAVCPKYITTSWQNRANKTLQLFEGYGHAVHITDEDFTDAATFKSAMSGVMLDYELATPTTESVTPILPYIEVEGDGTIGLTHTESPATESKFTAVYAQ